MNPVVNPIAKTLLLNNHMALMGSGGALVPDNYPELGLAYLQANARFFYDFTNLTGANGAAISNGNAGLEDIGPNNMDAVIVGTPIVRDLALRYGSTIKTLQDSSTNAVSIGNNGLTIFNSSFEIWFVFETQDGQPDTQTQNIFGGIIPTSLGINLFVSSAASGNGGKFTLAYGNSDGVFQKRTTNVIWQNGVNGLSLFRIVVDFESDDVEFYLNGYPIASAYTTGTIVGKNPANWNNTSNIYVGSLNNNGTPVTNANLSSVVAFGITPLLSDDDALYVQSYLLSRFNWTDEITINSQADVSTLRTSLISAITNGAGLDTLSPTVVTGHTGVMHICDSANITGWSSINRLSFTKNDVDGFTWTNRDYILFTNSGTPKNKLVINIQGHISDSSTAHETWMSQLLADGYDVLFVALPIASNDNVETNPSITQQSTGGHDQIFSTGLDRAGYNAMVLYFFDKTSSISYLQNLFSYDAIFCCGISGGGWGTTLLMALDSRISRGVCVRGTLPASLKDNSLGIFQEGDYEQGGTMFNQVRCGPRIFDMYTDHSYIDMYIMNSSVTRRFKLVNHLSDTCCFGGTTPQVIAPKLINKAITLGGKFEQATDTDPATATHAYSLFDRTEMINFFNAS